jgi:hypothetical protein
MSSVPYLHCLNCPLCIYVCCESTHKSMKHWKPQRTFELFQKLFDLEAQTGLPLMGLSYRQTIIHTDRNNYGAVTNIMLRIFGSSNLSPLGLEKYWGILNLHTNSTCLFWTPLYSSEQQKPQNPWEGRLWGFGPPAGWGDGKKTIYF